MNHFQVSHYESIPPNFLYVFGTSFEVLSFNLQGVPGITSYLLRSILTESSGSSQGGLPAEAVEGHLFSMEDDRLMYSQSEGCCVS